MKDLASPEFRPLVGRVSYLVYYEDTDLSGFVYHANYLKYFERAREHIIGVRYLSKLFHKGIHFVVSKANLNFLAPLSHGERVVIESVGHYSRSPAIVFDQKAWLVVGEMDPGAVLSKKESSVLVCQGEVTIVALNKENRPIRMPDELLEQFSKSDINLTELNQ